MANEAVCYVTPTRFARYTVADGAGIAKGALLKLSTPNTAALATADNDVFGGIAWMEKVASDGSTEIVAALDGIWGLATGSAITIGNEVSMDVTNTVKVYTTLDKEKGYSFGKALNTTAGAGTIVVRLNE